MNDLSLQQRSRPAFPFAGRDLDDVFEGFFRPMRGFGRTSAGGALLPALDVTDHDDRIEVHAELPGFSKEDIDLSVEDGRLTIRAEHDSGEQEKRDDEGRAVLRERRYGRFERSIEVGRDVDPDGIRASYADGVLAVTVPKPEDARRTSRRIAVE